MIPVPSVAQMKANSMELFALLLVCLMVLAFAVWIAVLLRVLWLAISAWRSHGFQLGLAKMFVILSVAGVFAAIGSGKLLHLVPAILLAAVSIIFVFLACFAIVEIAREIRNFLLLKGTKKRVTNFFNFP